MSSDVSLTPGRRKRARALGCIFAFGPLLIVVAFVVLWLRSYPVQEMLFWENQYRHLDPAAGEDFELKRTFAFESGLDRVDKSWESVAIWAGFQFRTLGKRARIVKMEDHELL